MSEEDRLYGIFTDPDLMAKITAHVTNGGSLIDMASLLRVRYSDFMRYIRQDKERSAAYDNAVSDRAEWAKERVLVEMRRIATLDLRDAYKASGELKPPSEWSPELAAVIAGVDTREIFDADGNKVAEMKRLKMWDKLKALEMLAKNLKLLTDRVEHSGSLTLEDMVVRSKGED